MGGIATSLVLSGCPANLENAQSFDIDNPNGGAPAAMVPLLEPPACVVQAINLSCATMGCHRGNTPAAKLDLDPTDPKAFASRLVNVPATHEGASSTAGCPKDLKLIDPQNPDMSWLLLKITKSNEELNCGFKMPIGPGLEPDELTCITQYIKEAATKASGGAK